MTDLIEDLMDLVQVLKKSKQDLEVEATALEGELVFTRLKVMKLESQLEEALMSETDLARFEAAAGKRFMLLRLIDEFWARHYRAPTIRELCELSGNNSTSYVSGMLERLAVEGYLLQTGAPEGFLGSSGRHYVPRWVARQIDGASGRRDE